MPATHCISLKLGFSANSCWFLSKNSHSQAIPKRFQNDWRFWLGSNRSTTRNWPIRKTTWSSDIFAYFTPPPPPHVRKTRTHTIATGPLGAHKQTGLLCNCYIMVPTGTEYRTIHHQMIQYYLSSCDRVIF